MNIMAKMYFKKKIKILFCSNEICLVYKNINLLLKPKYKMNKLNFTLRSKYSVKL